MGQAFDLIGTLEVALVETRTRGLRRSCGAGGDVRRDVACPGGVTQGWGPRASPDTLGAEGGSPALVTQARERHAAWPGTL